MNRGNSTAWGFGISCLVLAACAVRPAPAPPGTPANHIIACCNGLQICGNIASCGVGTCGFEQRPRDTGQTCGTTPTVDGGVTASLLARAPSDSQRIVLNSGASGATLVQNGVTTSAAISGIVNHRETESGSEITRIQLGLSEISLAGVSFRSGFVLNAGVLPISTDGDFFLIEAANPERLPEG